MEVTAGVWLILWSSILTPVIYFVYHAVWYIIEVRKRGQAVDKFTGEPKHWLWGHLHLFPGHNEAGLEYMRNQVKKYSGAMSFWMGNYLRPSVVVNHPDTFKAILKTSEPKPMGLGVYGYGKDWLGEGLLLSSGNKWARNRRLLTPAFHFDVLKPYITVKNIAVERLLDKMAPNSISGKSFEFFGNVSLLTFDIILRCAFSYENDVQTKGEDHPYVQAVSTLGNLWVKRTLKPWLHSNFLYYLTKDGQTFKKNCEFVHNISGEIIQKRKQTLVEKGESALRNDRYLDFLDILLTARDEDGVGLSDQDIRDEVDTFLFEGHDTTASALSWALYSLAENPEHQTLCQQEIDGILDGRQDDSITWHDLAELKYVTLCIKESMRMSCPVPFIQRETINEITIKGVVLPPKSLIDVHIYQLHHNPHVWEEPMEFRPSRFLPENFSSMDSFAFAPFSAGPRNCIGQHFAMHELKVLLARILRRYTVSLDPDFKVKKKPSVVMKTENGMYMKIKLRVHK